MPVRMKLQVPLRMPCSDRIWLAARLCASAAMIGMPPATLASKATARPCSRAGVEDLGAVLGQQRLVGGDHVLAGRQRSSTACLAQSMPPTSSTTTWTRGSPSSGGRSVVTSSAAAATAAACRIADDDAPQHQRPAGAGGEAVGMFEEQLGHAAADGAAADQGNAERFHFGRVGSAHRLRRWWRCPPYGFTATARYRQSGATIGRYGCAPVHYFAPKPLSLRQNDGCRFGNGRIRWPGYRRSSRFSEWRFRKASVPHGDGLLTSARHGRGCGQFSAF